MGWKLTSIIIKYPGLVTDHDIINSLFSNNYTELGPATFDECMYPNEDNMIYFGNYEGTLIISTYAAELVNKFFTDKLSKAEEIFTGLFPDSEIGAFALHSSMNYYAWTILSEGKKIRTKKGDGDNGITCDFGTPLPEEAEFLAMSFKDKKGALKYNWKRKNGNIEVYTEDQIGEEYVSRIWARFTGIEMFYDDTLFETEFRGYVLKRNGEEDEEEDYEEPEEISFWRKLFRR